MNNSILLTPLKIVLLIGTDFIENFVHRRLLESMNIADKFIEFNTPVEAINYLKVVHDLYDKSGDNSIDLIVLDAEISQLDVWEFLEQFKIICADYQSRPKIIIVSETLNQKQVEGFESGKLVSGIIYKPLDPQKILTCFKTIYGLQHFIKLIICYYLTSPFYYYLSTPLAKASIHYFISFPRLHTI